MNSKEGANFEILKLKALKKRKKKKFLPPWEFWTFKKYNLLLIMSHTKAEDFTFEKEGESFLPEEAHGPYSEMKKIKDKK